MNPEKGKKITMLRPAMIIPSIKKATVLLRDPEICATFPLEALLHRCLEMTRQFRSTATHLRVPSAPSKTVPFGSRMYSDPADPKNNSRLHSTAVRARQQGFGRLPKARDDPVLNHSPSGNDCSLKTANSCCPPTVIKERFPKNCQNQCGLEDTIFFSNPLNKVEQKRKKFYPTQVFPRFYDPPFFEEYLMKRVVRHRCQRRPPLPGR